MSAFTVEWIPAAEVELARLWMLADDPAAVTAAQAAIDRLLARDPVRHGTHMAEGLHRLVHPPLTVFYTVDASQRLVLVNEVRYTP